MTDYQQMNVGALTSAVGRLCKDKGWRQLGTFEDYKAVTELALISSEVSEAIEEMRKGYGLNETYYNGTKPEGVPIELADVIIRALDFADRYAIDINGAVSEKLHYNNTRAHRHGGKAV